VICLLSMEKTSSPPLILVVDDDAGLLRLIQRCLQREGFLAETASSGAAAIEYLDKKQPDLMLLDLKLQDFEGQQMINRLNERGTCPAFIIITGQGDERVAVEMMKSGAMDYLVKDTDFLRFVPTVVRRVVEQLEKNRRLKGLEKEILEISERERRRFGQDLHDGLCQQLAGIELMSQVLEKKLAPKSKPDAASAGEIGRLVREAIGETRLLARGLSPVTLESEGLMSGLQELAGNTERMFHVHCQFVCPNPVPVNEPAVATHLYRIAQESVSNAIKHGKATNIRIELASKGEETTLVVRDNGVGFEREAPKNSGMGLRIMQYRAGVIGGSLSIKANGDRGSSVVCVFCNRASEKKKGASS